MRGFFELTREHFDKPTAIRKLSFLIMLVAALVSVGQGLRNAQKNSQDFQWSPSVLFLEGENPYEHYLSGNADQRIILSQEPNYAHGLYIVLAPFAKLDWSLAKIELLWKQATISGECVRLHIVPKSGVHRGEIWVILLCTVVHG